MPKRIGPKPEGKIEKPEDKVWLDWYSKLAPQEHESYLSKLGLGKEEIAEWVQTEGLKKAEKEKKE